MFIDALKKVVKELEKLKRSEQLDIPEEISKHDILFELDNIYYDSVKKPYENLDLTRAIWNAHTNMKCLEHGFDFDASFNNYSKITKIIGKQKMFNILHSKIVLKNTRIRLEITKKIIKYENKEKLDKMEKIKESRLDDEARQYRNEKIALEQQRQMEEMQKELHEKIEGLKDELVMERAVNKRDEIFTTRQQEMQNKEIQEKYQELQNLQEKSLIQYMIISELQQSLGKK